MNILFVHASAGAGHMKAAEALCQTSSTLYPAWTTQLADALDYAHPSFKRLYRGSYSALVSHLPPVWGVAFEVIDTPSLQSPIRAFRRVYNRVNVAGFQRYLCEKNFDCVVSTHFMPIEIAAALKRAGRITTRLMTVVTDFDVHRIWLADGVDEYCVASEWTRDKIISLGVEEARVHVTGIPTSEKFSQSSDRFDLKRKLGLKQDAFTVLVATGSFGIGPIEQIIDQLDGFQTIVVCGHNKDLYNRLRNRPLTDVKVCGLVDNMHELMAVADVMVTKPGGLSISEALVSQLPMIFFNAIPGQETNNIKVLHSYGIGKKSRSVQDIVEELTHMKDSRDYYMTLAKRSRELARPHAARDILRIIE